MSGSLTISASQSSLAGRKPHNEDSIGILIPEGPLLHSKGVTAIIADGVSGSADGRQASELCVQGFLHDYYSTPESWATKTSGMKVLGALNRWLYGQGIRQYNSSMGLVTTASALILKSATAHILHIGDTRIYRLRDNHLEQLTKDHRILSSGDKTFLSNALGVDSNLQIEYSSAPLEPHDIFILVTDGVYEFIGENELIHCLQQHAEDVEESARFMTELAIARGSNDNVSCQIIRIESIPFRDDETLFYRRLSALPFPPPLEAGQTIDGFRILRRLHESKRTEVYLATHAETGLKAAIKTPSVNYSDDPDFIDRFLHEEWVGRRIDNPHVLKILPHPGKRSFLYYLMEYTEGKTLRQWMLDNPAPSLTVVRELAAQIMRGLRAFHKLEMIHQDLKPENIIIDPDGIIKIIDFGSTKIAGIEEISTPLRSQDSVLGTINYTAPEIFSGMPGGVQSDLYSLGVLIYEMLTGKLPYGPEPNRQTFNRREYTSARTYNEQVPPWVDGALKKATHKSPEFRYRELSEFVYDLSNPNSLFLEKKFEPLIQRNPAAFWKVISALLLIANIVLVYFLARQP